MEQDAIYNNVSIQATIHFVVVSSDTVFERYEDIKQKV